jgi:uncharacterized damage-inducible protein DinB
MSAVQTALDQIKIARMYTNDLLSHIDDRDWFRQPAEGVTHVAWQAGHLAVAQYGLALKRVRGEKPEDESLISQDFRKAFGKGSTPDPNPAQNPSPAEIRSVMARVHQQVIDEISVLSEDVANETTGDPPHPMFSTKLGALGWCAQHEFIHDGQIALLRRLFGAEPLR